MVLRVHTHQILSLIVTFAFLFVFPASAIPTAKADMKRDALRNGKLIRQVFGKVAAQAREWTCEIFVDNKTVAYGTIVDSNGLIITKASEIASDSCVCVFSDGSEALATLLAVDSENDLALLGVPKRNLVPVKWSTRDLKVGRFVASMTSDKEPTAIGIVSVPERAIPRQRSSLGVSFGDNEDGLVFSRVFSNSAAAKFGLLKGDKLISIGNNKILKLAEVREIFSKLHPGEFVSLKVERDEKELEVKVRMGDIKSTNTKEFMTSLLMGRVNDRRGGFSKVIQHDAPLLKYECGGPLIGSDGLAIGVNIARADRVESFAIPADLVKKTVEQLRKKVVWPPLESVPESTKVKQTTSITASSTLQAP